MKKIFIFWVSFISCFPVYAQELQCSKNYPLFEKMMEDKMMIMKNGNFEEVLRFKDKYAYSTLFDSKYLGKMFTGVKWVSPEEYADRVKRVMDDVKSGFIVDDGNKLFPIKYNGILSAGEVCVIPVEARFMINGKEKLDRKYTIYVRNLKTNEWRSLIYSDYISKDDFNEFFPDFPNDIDLSKVD